MKKVSEIKSDMGDNKCPFHLPIPQGCENAGNSVLHMYPLEKDAVGGVNQRIYLYYKTDERCLYASNIVKDMKCVNCDYNSPSAGQHVPAIEGSPLYLLPFTGVNLDGWRNGPAGTYGDNYPMRNVPIGLYSLISEQEYQLIKQASIENDKIYNIISKIDIQEELTKEESEEIEKLLKGG